MENVLILTGKAYTPANLADLGQGSVDCHLRVKSGLLPILVMSKLIVVFIFLNGCENKPNEKNTSWCKKTDEIEIASGHSHARRCCMAACERQRHS